MDELEIDESCPECHAGKCGNCDGSTWSNEEDARVICPCATQDHPRRST